MNRIVTGTRSRELSTRGGFTRSVSGETYSISQLSWLYSSGKYRASVSLNGGGLSGVGGYRWGVTDIVVTSYSLTRSGTAISCTVEPGGLLANGSVSVIVSSKPSAVTTLTISYTYTDSTSITSIGDYHAREYYYDFFGKKSGTSNAEMFNPATPLAPTEACDVYDVLDEDRVEIWVYNDYPYDIPISSFYVWISEEGGSGSWDETDLDSLIAPANSDTLIFQSQCRGMSQCSWNVTLGGISSVGNTGFEESTFSGEY